VAVEENTRSPLALFFLRLELRATQMLLDHVQPFADRAIYGHWVQTGPHVMIVGPMVREMPGYPRNADVSDPTQPYVMFPGTPYEHLMLPVTAGK
jgi:hypothetical protein